MISPLTGSLYEEAFREAERHKWIESQKSGRDLGDIAVRDWYRRYWNRYCRYRQVEHLKGNECWREFGPDLHGRLNQLILDGDLLVDRVMDRVYAGWENLAIINWAFEWNLAIDRVLEILAEVDVNRGRLDPCC